MTDSDEDDFSRLIGPVRRLHHDRIEPETRRPRTRLRRPYTESRSQALTDSGDLPEQVESEWFDPGLQKRLCQRICRGELTIDAHLDLHGLRRDEALQQLEAFLDMAVDQGCRFLVIVHGQGYGSRSQAVLKPVTRHWLSRQDSVLAWCPAQPRHGGNGATYVYLRRGAPEKRD